jgi:hypothetical protein
VARLYLHVLLGASDQLYQQETRWRRRASEDAQPLLDNVWQFELSDAVQADARCIHYW